MEETREIAFNVAQIATGRQECLYTGNLDALYPGSDVTMREFVRQCFAELGIEIEFSGKDRHEKGVVIDMDEDKIAGLGLNADTLRFGQTVVRVK
ncbi:hypothetical protein BEL04_23680 [Mucilaginibacter sp. PPCGB 2223]|uniref:hypothetical protein n=1 Tax=Mucilaginibacter sp. PPCGB 2223 TaxID=1886027 RepID=UPI00082553A4|nr:hypothetical protein [Mucilaginibacter sp. PPCGB 2223]OCX50311.1 hypothetical protein BEL04_23680 [Mucilaginibacter sp. PPCGB 2223]